MPYDLYGNYYRSEVDAMNAEMAQCNEIDQRITNKKVQELEKALYERSQPSEDLQHIWQYIEHLEARIALLESKVHIEK